MSVSPLVFMLLLVISLLMLVIGRGLGRLGDRVARGALSIAVFLIFVAAVPRFRPTLLHTTLPLGISIWLEGVLASLPWMLMVGVLWTAPFTRRYHGVARWMILLGVLYLLFGGIWMLLPDIRVDKHELRTHPPNDATALTLQTRPDTCVPSACASALRMMGVPATEGEMCAVVMARPTRGSTLARAAHGLGQHLRRRGITVSVEDLDARDVVYLASPKQPILVVIKSNLAADHMVVVLGQAVMLKSDQNGVVIANPSPGYHGVPCVPLDEVFRDPGYAGYEILSFDDFERVYRGGAIVFDQSERTALLDPSAPSDADD